MDLTQKNGKNMPIRVYNTLSKIKEPFETLMAGQVGIYLCGPTVYKESHIGHMVGPVIFDTIKRYLVYNGYDVTWIVNITDIDDKLIAQSRERGIPTSQIATEMIMDYCANLLELGVDQISEMPRATEHIPEITSIIQDLIDQGFAYASGGDVFFDVTEDPQYGKLSNRSADEQQGAGGGAASKKRSPGDFALWKAAKEGEPSWDSPWGAGRPGWHIECSAMSRALLGNSFDIHGGGLDLVFPHHENEIAQSECCHQAPMAKYWMHNGLLRTGDKGKVGGRNDRTPQAADEEDTGAKMSRSKGAGGLRGVISRHGGERIRFFLLRTHYRSTIVYNEEGLDDARTALEKFYKFFERYERVTGGGFYLDTSDPDEERQPIRRRDDGKIEAGQSSLLDEVREIREQFLAKMDDDFNSGGAVSELFNLLAALNRFVDLHHLEQPKQRNAANLTAFLRAVETLRELSATLGLFKQPPTRSSGGGDDQLTDKLMQLLIELRTAARQNKDFATADKIRNDLNASGITLEDRQEGTTYKRGDAAV
jgi:cysteinyl-tRNA synthetase